jgi:hypothetical protein
VPRAKQEFLKHHRRERGWKYRPGKIAPRARAMGKILPPREILAGPAGNFCRL